MKKRAHVEDFYRKINIVFYPKSEEEVEEFKQYFNPTYFLIKGVSLFDDINRKSFRQVPDVIVCTDNYRIISNKVEKYVHYYSFLEYINNPKEVCHEIRKKAFHNYIDKIKMQILSEIENAKNFEIAIKNIIDLLDLKQEGLKDHSIRVMHYALMIGKLLNLDQESLNNLKYASLLHDIGKLAIPSRIISKPSDYSEYEFVLYKYHPIIGDYLLDFPDFEKIRLFIRLHHERIDGKGYLKRRGIENIPLESRIILVANTFDRLTTSIFFEKRYSYQEAIQILEKFSNKVSTKRENQPMDPEIVKLFINEMRKSTHLFIDMENFLDNSLKDKINVEK